MTRIRGSFLSVRRKYRVSQTGNVTVTFALMLTLAGGLAGSAIDFGSAVSAQTSMQTSLDAVTLRIA